MKMSIDSSSITNLQQLPELLKEKSRLFLHALANADYLEQLGSVIEDVELRDDENIEYLLRVNEQHVTACIHVSASNDTAIVSVISYF